MNKNRSERRAGGLGAWWVGGGAALLTCLLMVSSSAAGAATAATITYKAPYHHALVTPMNDIIELSGCGKEIGKPATFSTATGFGHWAGSASARSCSGPAGKAIQGSVALVQDAVAVALPVRVPFGHATATSFNVTWNVTALGNYSLVYSGSCPGAVYNATRGYGYSFCIAEAITQTIGYAYLVDMTTGVITYPTGFSGFSGYAYKYVENYSYCSSASSCTYSNYTYSTPFSSFVGSTLVSYTINATTNSADRYAVVTYVGGDIVDEMQVYTGTAAGFINMGTLGNGYQLVSIVET